MYFSVGHHINLFYDCCICVSVCAHVCTYGRAVRILYMYDEVRMELRCNVDLSLVPFLRGLK